VVAAFGALALIGALWSVHMRLNWRLRRNRGSGLGVAIVLVLLGATSIGIYYFGDELWSTAASIVHTLAGVAAAAVFAYHWLAGRKIARDRARRPQIVVDSGATLQHARRSETTERPRVRAQR
jgi:hypothetical protein